MANFINIAKPDAAPFLIDADNVSIVTEENMVCGTGRFPGLNILWRTAGYPLEVGGPEDDITAETLIGHFEENGVPMCELPHAKRAEGKSVRVFVNPQAFQFCAAPRLPIAGAAGKSRTALTLGFDAKRFISIDHISKKQARSFLAFIKDHVPEIRRINAPQVNVAGLVSDSLVFNPAKIVQIQPAGEQHVDLRFQNGAYASFRMHEPEGGWFSHFYQKTRLSPEAGNADSTEAAKRHSDICADLCRLERKTRMRIQNEFVRRAARNAPGLIKVHSQPPSFFQPGDVKWVYFCAGDESPSRLHFCHEKDEHPRDNYQTVATFTDRKAAMAELARVQKAMSTPKGPQ